MFPLASVSTTIASVLVAVIALVEALTDNVATWFATATALPFTDTPLRYFPSMSLDELKEARDKN